MGVTFNPGAYICPAGTYTTSRVVTAPVVLLVLAVAFVLSKGASVNTCPVPFGSIITFVGS